MKRIIALLAAALLTLTSLAALCTLPASAEDGAALAASGTARLSTLTLDGGYTVDFAPDTFDYTVFLPAGRPRIPRIDAKAGDGCTVRIYNAALADDEADGYGYVSVAQDGENATVYRIRFVRSASLGYVLQYDDVISFEHGLSGNVSFSSDSAALSVSKTGVITAKAVSDTPATVTATAPDGKTATLRVDRIIPAQLDIVMSVGQSNAYGSGGNASLSERVRPGTAYDIGYDGNTQSDNFNTHPIPLATNAGTGTAVSGVRGAFANEWYATTGEKLLFINAADPGIKIAAWQSNGAAYIGAKKEYERVVALIESSENFEIYRRFFYFNHGSADAGKNFNAEYYERVCATFNNLFAELGMEFGTIFEYFSSDRSYTSWIRSQHNRIVSEMDRIYMGCEMKPYIQADPSLINSDNLHLSQAGHNLCGRLLAQNTAAQALIPDGKFPGSLSGADAPAIPSLASEPTLAWDFDGSLAPTAGDITLSLGGGTESVRDGALCFADGASWYATSAPIRLTTSSDWMLELRFRLEGESKQFALLGSPDNSAQVYVNLSDGTTKGFKVRYGTPGLEGTAITLSVRDVNELYTMNTWRLYYRAELGLLYLWRDGELQSTELLSGPMTLSQLGRTGDITMAGKTAALDSLRVWYERTVTGEYSFGFENTLQEDNGLMSFSANGGSYEAASVQLKYASSNLSFDKISLDSALDWSVEVRGSFTKNTGVLASADGSNTIFANVSDPGFRVRYTSSSYVKLAVSAGDFKTVHTWRIAYSAENGTLTLYRDGEKLTSKAMKSSLAFTNSGTSGSTGSSNSALIDYISIEQKNVNRGGGDSIIFNFNNSLSDDSGSYTMTVLKGAATFVQSDMGYVLAADTRLTASEPVSFGDKSFSLSLYAAFEGVGEVIGGLMSVGQNSLRFAGVEFALDDATDISRPGRFTLDYDKSAGTLTLTCPDGAKKTAPASFGTLTLDTLGGAAMKLYSLSLSISSGKKAPVRAEVSVAAEGNRLTASVTSDIWKPDTVDVRYQWLRDGHVIPGAMSSVYLPTTDDVGHSLSCLAILSGTPERASGGEIAVDSSTEVLPTAPEVVPGQDTTAPGVETSAPDDTTSAPDSAIPITPDDTTAPGTKRGCGSSVRGRAMSLILVAAAAACISRKRRRSCAAQCPKNRA